MSETNPRNNSIHFNGRERKRCRVDKCRKLAKDEGLCRLHSPYRINFVEKKKKK